MHLRFKGSYEKYRQHQNKMSRNEWSATKFSTMKWNLAENYNLETLSLSRLFIDILQILTDLS